MTARADQARFEPQARVGPNAKNEHRPSQSSLLAFYTTHHDELLIAVAVLAGLLVQIVASLDRGDVGLDVVAALSMAAALAFGQPLAGNVVALMYAGGQILEDFAQGRARKEMTAPLGRVARTACASTARPWRKSTSASSSPATGC